MNKIELLAPAGSKEAFLAAIVAGADAVYFGTNQFNARERAENIKLEDLPELVAIAKNHKVKTYLTLNVLIYNQEIPAALELVKSVTEIGVDAIIVQDIGLLSLIRQNFPDVEIHASTQLTTHNIEQCKFLAKMGVKQVNLSRELSLEEIKPIAKYLKSQNIGCEVFVHGAYCISYSGQCYLSGYLYNLKGNRGSCVQPCRRQYNFSEKNINSFSPFNLKDNCVFPLSKKLAEAGATSFKIEGRIKSPEYVYSVTKAYREQIDRIYQNQELLTSDSALNFSMNRSFSTGYLEGNIHKEMFTYGHKDHSLVYAGKVFSYYANKNILSVNIQENELEKNYLITILNPDNSFVCTGIIEEKKSSSEYIIKITGKLSGKIKKDCQVFFTKELISKETLLSLTSALKPKKYNISAQIHGKLNSPLQATFTLETPISSKSPLSITLSSPSLLQPASNKALSKEVIFDKFSRLGGTDFRLANLELSPDFAKESFFLPLGELNNLRRLAVEYFSEILQKEKPQLNIKDFSHKTSFTTFPKDFFQNPTKNPPVFFFDSIQSFSDFTSKYSIDFSNFSYITCLLEMPLTLAQEREIYQDFFSKYPKVVPYFSSILFQNHFNDVVDFLSSGNLQTIVADNLGLFEYAKDSNIKIISGYHLNVFNSQSASYFSENYQPKAIILSPELSKEELLQFQIPENQEIWLPDLSGVQLMQSRQCLLRNIPDKTGAICEKAATDFECIKNCSKSKTIFGTQKEVVVAKKRKGFYSALYPFSQNKAKPDFRCIVENLPNTLDKNPVRQIFYISAN